MSATVNINAAFERKLTAAIDKGLGAAVTELRDKVKEDISTLFPPASEPGTPPHRRTGGLHEAVFAERAEPMHWAYGYGPVAPARPGSDRTKLGIWLELGTLTMDDRPILMKTLMVDGPAAINKHLTRVM
jgi:hypothetical protein